MLRRYKLFTLDEMLDAMGIPYKKVENPQFVCPRCGSRIRLLRFATSLWACTVCKWKWDGFGEGVGVEPVVKPPTPYEKLELARRQWRCDNE